MFDVVLIRWYVCFFFKQKTAYEMRISDWSSDVCSSDLLARTAPHLARYRTGDADQISFRRVPAHLFRGRGFRGPDRKSVVSGKSVSVRVDLGGRRLIKTKRTCLIGGSLILT